MNQLTASLTARLIAKAQANGEHAVLSTAGTDNRHFALRQGPTYIHLQIRTEWGTLLSESRYTSVATAKDYASSHAARAQCGTLAWVDVADAMPVAA